MAAIWEGIPFVGPVFGGVADVVQNLTLEGAKMAGTGLDALANAAVGQDRKERGLTELPTWCVDKLSDKDMLVRSAEEIVRGAGDTPLAELFGEALRRVLNSPRSILGATSGVLAAALANVGQLGILHRGIFSNEINAATLGLVWNNFDGLVSFLVDLAECVKCYASASSLDGKARQGSPHGRYNEFDMSQPMNRHSIICQIQRLVKSTIFILRQTATPAKFGDINMTKETTLRSDDYESGTVLEVRPSGWQRVVGQSQERPWVRLPTGAGLEERCSRSDEPPKVTNEKWFFVNGIATELFWLHLACKKLAEKYSREITGVYNRGDGILWDLIECAGERDASGKCSAKSQKKIIERTESSKMAQESLKKQLQVALEEGRGSRYAHIVVIAHSQGCLLLRLALEELIISACQDTGNIRRTMLDRLCVFTFGNPSVDWKLECDSNKPIERLKNSKQDDNVDLGFLSSHVLCTEHFANETDFVAKLGVLSEHKNQQDSGYEEECLFVNRGRDWIGHLFGTQYSLDYTDYKDQKKGEQTGDEGQVTGGKSLLLTCQDGVSIQDARNRLMSRR
ncbi:hypothetical protein B0I37DRAFT_360974 [Chaetomium sp. MPI-CAGE-AT-0009]|nr:hypothetical protein B0I37DRAFT_360974 [Chaetomium sp. MPI-CAGE-AT-0009]